MPDNTPFVDYNKNNLRSDRTQRKDSSYPKVLSHPRLLFSIHRNNVNAHVHRDCQLRVYKQIPNCSSARVKKIKSSQILKSTTTDTRYLALYDSIALCQLAQTQVCESYELSFLVSLGHRHRETRRWQLEYHWSHCKILSLYQRSYGRIDSRKPKQENKNKKRGRREGKNIFDERR